MGRPCVGMEWLGEAGRQGGPGPQETTHRGTLSKIEKKICVWFLILLLVFSQEMTFGSKKKTRFFMIKWQW